jgi:hypothetical protein
VSLPKVGIFFVVESQLVIDAVPVDQGEPYGETIEHGSHDAFWDSMVPWTALEHRFKTRAYDASPRGRVVYLTREQRFVLYADACLTRDTLQGLATHFGLTAPVVARDEHYQCAACNPSLLD